MSIYSTLLFARPSFIEGVARLLDFGNTLQVYNISRDDAEADAHALASDWYAIGEDLKLAVQEILRSNTLASEDEQTKPDDTKI